MIELRRRYASGSFTAPNYKLPVEYQQVEWIGSSGDNKQYIDTGVVPDENGYYEVKFQATGASGEWKTLFYAEPYYAPIRQTPSGFTGAKGVLIAPFDNDMHICVQRANTKTWDGIERDISRFNGIQEATSSILLFYSIGPYGIGLAARVAYFKLYDSDDTILLYFIPCYRKADNEAGMYDIVNGVFHTNAGTGEFIVGPDVIG